jgi:hypothetical protein
MNPLEERLKTYEQAKKSCLAHPDNKNLLPYVEEEIRRLRNLLSIKREMEDEKWLRE